MPTLSRVLPLIAAVALLSGCSAPEVTTEATARPTPSVTFVAAPVDTRIVTARAAAELTLADARSVFELSAGAVDDERRAVLGSAIAGLETAITGTSADALIAAEAAVVDGVRVVAGRIVELGQSALDNSGSAAASARVAVEEALTNLRAVLDARAAAGSASSVVLTAATTVRESHQANLAAAEIARREAEQAAEEEATGDEEEATEDSPTPDPFITFTPAPLVVPDLALPPAPPYLQ